MYSKNCAGGFVRMGNAEMRCSSSMTSTTSLMGPGEMLRTMLVEQVEPKEK